MKEVVCPICKILWDRIRRDEDDVRKMEKHPKVYGKTLKQLKEDLDRRYERAKECRRKNHPDTMY